MASTTLVVRGFRIRTQSHFRYQIVSVSGNDAVIVGRSDSLESAVKRAGNYHSDGRVYVVVDRTTNEEITSFPRQQPEPSTLEQQIQEEEGTFQEGQEQQFIEPEDTSGTAIDPAALFLVDLIYPNMFEARGVPGSTITLPFCKVCGEQVDRSRQEAHHAGHKRDRANHTSEQRSQKEQHTMAKKTNNTVTPRSQGVPDVYLNEDGSKFKPGLDARLKADLIAAIDDLDKSKALYTFDPQTAAQILAARGWNEWLVKSRNGREAKATRAKVKAAQKEKKVKDEVAARRQAKAEVKPDPKPERRPRSRRPVGA